MQYIYEMVRSRQKRKTATLSLRVAPQVKAAAEKAAELDNRSLASFIEVLILSYCKTQAIGGPTAEKEPSP